MWIISAICLNGVVVAALLRPLETGSNRTGENERKQDDKQNKESSKSSEPEKKICCDVSTIFEFSLLKSPTFLVYGCSCFLCMLGREVRKDILSVFQYFMSRINESSSPEWVALTILYTRDDPKFRSWNVTRKCNMQHALKFYNNNNILFVYTMLYQVLCYLNEWTVIYPEIAIHLMHWPIKQSVHIRDLTIKTRAVSAIRFYGVSMFIPGPICPVHMSNFLYDLGFLGPWMYCYANVSYNQILDHLKFWSTHTTVTTVVLKVKNDMQT